jgi:zinc transport system substrate-binding protein
MLVAGSALAKDLKVVTSIKPVHSLTAAVMEGAGQPQLIVKGGASPHSTSLRPSEAAALEQADVVIWIGEGLETFLTSPLEALAKNAKVVELGEAPGLTRLPYRAGGAWDGHEHEEHGHEAHGHEEHAHEEHAHDEHGHQEHAAQADHEDAKHHEEEHHHGGIDQHFWLDPLNATAMVEAIAAALIEADPENSDLYADNAQRLAMRIESLTAEISAQLAPVKEVPFVVFHDAYQYLDRRFGLANVGSVTVDPEQQPGAQRLKEIQAKIGELNARCVFAEPQFEPKLIAVVIEGTAAKTGTLDPIGADIPDGPELYFELLRSNAAALKACLGEAS